MKNNKSIKKGNILYYKNIVKKIFLLIMLFLNDEFRSSNAYELVPFYNDDNDFFLNSLWRKTKRTSFENDFIFDYLINNLYFIGSIKNFV